MSQLADSLEKQKWQETEDLLMDFKAISLPGMERVALMNRVDTKFIGPADMLPTLLKALSAHYQVLEIDNCRLFPYKTAYFDTKGFHMYEAHHNGKLNRYKVRRREYVKIGLQFLEVKFKNNKGRTIKNRIARPDATVDFTSKEHVFLKDHSPYEGNDLEFKLNNRFNRITLAGEKERITIDFDLEFWDDSDSALALPEIFILELKQSKLNANSIVRKILKKHCIRPQSFSKYCVGTASLNKALKSNRLKQKLNLIEKIKSQIDN